jgi:hypothetical protein
MSDIERLHLAGIRYKFYYSTISLIISLVCILVGALLFMLGITGSSSWTAKVLGFESKITDAAPGTILFVVGLFFVFFTRFTVDATYTPVRVEDSSQPDSPANTSTIKNPMVASRKGSVIIIGDHPDETSADALPAAPHGHVENVLTRIRYMFPELGNVDDVSVKMPDLKGLDLSHLQGLNVPDFRKLSGLEGLSKKA